MGIYADWSEYAPDFFLSLSVTSGVLSIDTGSLFRNPGNFDWSDTPQVILSLFKNGNFQHMLAVNQSTRAITGNTLNVSEDDTIEVRTNYTGPESVIWKSTPIFRRSAFLTVGATDASWDFDASTNAMPTPLFEMGFGWDTNDNLKVGFSVSSDGGASQDLTCTTRLVGTTPIKESSTTIDLDTSNTQTHTSTFTKSDMTDSCEIELHLKSGTGTTRQETLLKVRFSDDAEVPSWDTSFPTTGVLLNQQKMNTGLRLGQP